MRSLQTVADGVHLGALGPGSFINVVVLDADGDGGGAGGLVVDSGLRWQRRRLQRLLDGVEASTHVVTHAHFDHLGSTAWLCRHLGADLAMGREDAALFDGGRIDTLQTRAGRALSRTLDPERRAVDRPLADGDRLGPWEVLTTPGHSPGSIALWRDADRVLLIGHGPVNLGSRTSPRWLRLPEALNHDLAEAAASRRRLVDLDPAVVVSTHGAAARVDDAWRRAMLRP